MGSRREFLHRDDIVGQRVLRILTSPWRAEDDGFGGCSAYVELESGDTFELLYQDTNTVRPVKNHLVNDLNVEEVADDYLMVCFGKKICEVVKTEYWPSFGLLLETEILLYTRDFPNINRSGALLIGPYADKLGEFYTREEIAPYWD